MTETNSSAMGQVRVLVNSLSRRRTWLGPPALSLASQAVGVLQLLLLLWRYGATNATDTYFYLFNLGNLPIQILVVGVLYPLLLNDERVSRRGAALFARWVPAAGIAAVGVGAGWLHVTGRVGGETLPIIAFSALNAFMQARVWVRAVAAEAGGTPHWVSGVALPANLFATTVIALPWPNSDSTVTAMTAVLAVANAGLLLLMVKCSVGDSVFHGLSDHGRTNLRAPMWFVSKSTVSYGGLMVVQSVSLILPPATLTLLTIPMKIVASVSATFTNAILPRLVHQTTESPSEGRYFLRVATATLMAVGLVVVLVSVVFFEDYWVIAAVVSLWLVASSASSVAQRLAFRFLAPSASRITIVVVPVLVFACILSAQTANFGLLALLCVYAMVDAASAFLLLAALRNPVEAVVIFLTASCIAFIWCASLLNWVSYG